MQGIGFLLVLVVLGGMREILGQGTLFDGAELLLGEWATSLKLVIFEFERSFISMKRCSSFIQGFYQIALALHRAYHALAASIHTARRLDTECLEDQNYSQYLLQA